MATERTLSIIKPDAVAKNVIGEIITRFEKAELKVVAAKMVHLSQEQAEGFYAEHKERPFFPGLIKFVTSGPVVCMAWEGVEAIAVARKLIGATNGRQAEPGTIRGDFGMDMGYNMIHGSDGEDTAAAELALWFPEGVMEWTQDGQRWVYE